MKKIVIINGNPKSENTDFDKYLTQLSFYLKRKDNKVKMLILRDLKLSCCIGCYTCWFKTPGICIHKDHGPKILTEYINSDMIIMASPIIMGFTSALIKKIRERFLPLLHPFVYIKDDRMQHLSRYENNPLLILLLGKTDGYDDEDIEIIDNIYRSSKSSKFCFTKTMETDYKELANEINNI